MCPTGHFVPGEAVCWSDESVVRVARGMKEAILGAEKQQSNWANLELELPRHLLAFPMPFDMILRRCYSTPSPAP